MSQEKPRNQRRVWKRRRLLAHRWLCRAWLVFRLYLGLSGLLWMVGVPVYWFLTHSWPQIGRVAIVVAIAIPGLLLVGVLVGWLEQLKWPMVFRLALLMAIMLAATLVFMLAIMLSEAVFHA